jgi:Uma2 family endonuclease
MAAERLPRPFTVKEYHQLLEAGLFEGERLELLDGIIVRMPPLGLAHWNRHGQIVEYLIDLLRGLAQVRGQISLPLGDRDEPEPDIAILAVADYELRGRIPEPSEIFATIELANTSFEKDTETKRLLYAKFEIRDYLVVDLQRNELIHYSQPANGDYANTRIMKRDEGFVISALPQIDLASNGFLRKF